MAVTDSAKFAAFLSNLGANLIPWAKASIANTAAGQMFSLWRAAGNPDQGAIPTSWATCTNATIGAVPFTAGTGTDKTYIGHLSATLANIGSVQLFDRVAAMGGLAGNVATAQTVNGSITAGRAIDASGSDAEWYLDWYADTGGTAVNATVTYTAGDDSTGNTVVVALTATMRAGRMMRIPANAGKPIKSIQTVQLSATTGSAGNFGVTLRKRLAPPCSVVNVAIAESMDSWQIAMARLKDPSCVEFTLSCSTTSTGYATGLIGIGVG